MFAWKQRHCDAIPPTRGSFPEHIKREVYQGGVALAHPDSCIRQVRVPSHEHCGWMKEKINDSRKPKWTSLTAVASSCQELLKCGGKYPAVFVTVNATVLAFLVRVVV